MPEKERDNLTSTSAQRYQAMKNRLFLFHLFLQAGFLVLFLATGWSRSLKRMLLPVRDDFFSINALYLAAFSVIFWCVCFPLDYFEGYVWEHRFRLSRAPFTAWLADDLKKSLIAFFVALLLVEGVYYFLSVFPRTWWLAAAGLWFVVSVVISRVFPRFVLPLFFKVTPLAGGPLRDRLGVFCAGQGILLKDIFVLDFSRKTVKANAMVAGWGRAKKIFLSDTLVKDFAPEEVESVLAHEVGHTRHRDTWSLLFFGLGAALLSFFVAHRFMTHFSARLGFVAMSDIANLPLFLLILLGAGLFLLPVQNGFSRLLERRADAFALRATGRPDVFIAMMQRLGTKNLAQFAPARWVEIFLYDHPPMGARLRMARAFTPPLDYEI